MTFTEFVIKKHPDPDSIYGKVAEGYWDAIDKLAQQYADEQSLEFADFTWKDKELLSIKELLTRYHESQKP